MTQSVAETVFMDCVRPSFAELVDWSWIFQGREESAHQNVDVATIVSITGLPTNKKHVSGFSGKNVEPFLVSPPTHKPLARA